MTVNAEEDDAQPIEKSSLWSNRRSGLEMLRAMESTGSVQSSEDRWRDGLRATQATWREWRGVKRLRLWEALALHHHLDPSALDLTLENSEHYALMVKRDDLNFNDVLTIFSGQRAWLGTYVRNRSLQVEEVCDPLVNSVVSVEEFLHVFGGTPVLADPNPKRSALGLDALAESPQKPSSPYVEAVVAASALYRTVADGGSYVPGDHSTVPDVYGFLRKHYPWMPPTKCRQICEMVRPPDLPKGRKPKARVTQS